MGQLRYHRGQANGLNCASHSYALLFRMNNKNSKQQQQKQKQNTNNKKKKGGKGKNKNNNNNQKVAVKSVVDYRQNEKLVAMEKAIKQLAHPRPSECVRNYVRACKVPFNIMRGTQVCYADQQEGSTQSQICDLVINLTCANAKYILVYFAWSPCNDQPCVIVSNDVTDFGGAVTATGTVTNLTTPFPINPSSITCGNGGATAVQLFRSYSMPTALSYADVTTSSSSSKQPPSNFAKVIIGAHSLHITGSKVNTGGTATTFQLANGGNANSIAPSTWTSYPGQYQIYDLDKSTAKIGTRNVVYTEINSGTVASQKIFPQENNSLGQGTILQDSYNTYPLSAPAGQMADSWPNSTVAGTSTTNPIWTSSTQMGGANSGLLIEPAMSNASIFQAKLYVRLFYTSRNTGTNQIYNTLQGPGDMQHGANASYAVAATMANKGEGTQANAIDKFFNSAEQMLNSVSDGLTKVYSNPLGRAGMNAGMRKYAGYAVQGTKDEYLLEL